MYYFSYSIVRDGNKTGFKSFAVLEKGQFRLNVPKYTSLKSKVP